MLSARRLSRQDAHSVTSFIIISIIIIIFVVSHDSLCFLSSNNLIIDQFFTF